jgi:PPOX class probable F420-dependent enzyme
VVNARDARVARLATVDPDGRPHVVPICFALDGDTLYTAVDEKPKSTRKLRRLANIEANPRVEVVIDHWDEDWSQLWWVRLAGEARVVEHDARGLELLQAKYPQYRDAPPAGPFVVVTIDARKEWTASDGARPRRD